MSYARWATKNEVVEKLQGVNLETGVTKSGIPLAYDDNYLYINNREAHSLIIGSTGSGKTQSTILPMLKLSMMAKESIVLTDPKGELYDKCAGALKDKGYNLKIEVDTKKRSVSDAIKLLNPDNIIDINISNIPLEEICILYKLSFCAV